MMSEKRRTYKINPITVNQRRILQVVIDSHYELKHRSSVDDQLILDLVYQLNGRVELPDSVSGRYSYFVTLIEHQSKNYRLIWLLEKDAIYIGVVNAYRDRRKR